MSLVFEKIDGMCDNFLEFDEAFPLTLLKRYWKFPPPIVTLVGQYMDIHRLPFWLGFQLGVFLEQSPSALHCQRKWTEEFFRLAESQTDHANREGEQTRILVAADWIRRSLRFGPENGPRGPLIFDALVAGARGDLPLTWDRSLLETAIDMEAFERQGLPLRRLNSERPHSWAQLHKVEPKQREDPGTAARYQPYRRLRQLRVPQVNYGNSEMWSPY